MSPRPGPVVAICNQKGGVGKTSTLLALAAAAAAASTRVLAIDVDPQGNTSRTLAEGYDGPGVVELLTGAATLTDVTRPSDWEGVDVITTTDELARWEQDGGGMTALAAALAPDDHDIVLIDCPPSVGRITANALSAARLALVVTTPSVFGLDGVEKIVETIQVVQQHYNPDLRLAGIICNMAPARGREATLRLNELRSTYQGDLWEPPITRRAVVEEANGAGRPLSEFGAEALPITGPYAIHLAHLQNELHRTPRRSL